MQSSTTPVPAYQKESNKITISITNKSQENIFLYKINEMYRGSIKIIQTNYCQWWYYINITFPERVIVENIIPRNMIIHRGAAEVDNHISRDEIFDYHPLRECNIYFIIPNRTLDPLFPTVCFHLGLPCWGEFQRECMNERRYIFHKNGSVLNSLNARTDHWRSVK